MQIPIQISYHGIDKSEAIDALIREKAGRLEQFCDHIVSCRVAVEKPQRHQHTGNPYRVRLELRVPPGHDLVVTEDPGKEEMHAPLTKVIRDAFRAMERQLKKLVDRQRRDVKRHPHQETNAVVAKIFPEEGYGFLETSAGREIYFHENSVLHRGFSRLSPGTGVHFIEESGEEGPQASSVEITDKPAI